MAVGTSLHLDHLERFIRRLGMEMKYEREMIVVEKARGSSTPSRVAIGNFLLPPRSQRPPS